MRRSFKAIVFGIVTLGSVVTIPIEASAMPVAGVSAPVASATTGEGAAIEKTYWRRGYGWRGGGWGYGWRRPGWRYGWRRPFYRHPYRRFYRW